MQERKRKCVDWTENDSKVIFEQEKIIERIKSINSRTILKSISLDQKDIKDECKVEGRVEWIEQIIVLLTN